MNRCIAFNAFTASVCQLRPTSRGSMHIVSPDAHAAPLIAPNYLSTEYDRHVAANAMRLTRRIAAAPALAPYRPQEILPGIEFQTEEELAAGGGQGRHDHLSSGRHVPHGHAPTIPAPSSTAGCA